MLIKKIVVGVYAENCYMIMCEETKEAIIIDPGAQAELILRTLKENDAELKYVVLTHAHGDHIGAVPTIMEKTNAKLIASELENETLLSPTLNESARICETPISLECDHYVRDNERVTFGKESFKCISTPGHTAGGMCILIGDHLFSGDTLFRRSVGRTDLHGGSHETLISSIVFRLLVLDDHINVYPGHGPKSTIGEERKENPFI
jgi:glyoxylase-like metal-dependent hydrolase (beta-lactamase superfamily II)